MQQAPTPCCILHRGFTIPLRCVSAHKGLAQGKPFPSLPLTAFQHQYLSRLTDGRATPVAAAGCVTMPAAVMVKVCLYGWQL